VNYGWGVWWNVNQLLLLLSRQMHILCTPAKGCTANPHKNSKLFFRSREIDLTPDLSSENLFRAILYFFLLKYQEVTDQCMVCRYLNLTLPVQYVINWLLKVPLLMLG
jgi:hypothetical protein